MAKNENGRKEHKDDIREESVTKEDKKSLRFYDFVPSGFKLFGKVKFEGELPFKILSSYLGNEVDAKGLVGVLETHYRDGVFIELNNRDTFLYFTLPKDVQLAYFREVEYAIAMELQRVMGKERRNGVDFFYSVGEQGFYITVPLATPMKVNGVNRDEVKLSYVSIGQFDLAKKAKARGINILEHVIYDLVVDIPTEDLSAYMNVATMEDGARIWVAYDFLAQNTGKSEES